MRSPASGTYAGIYHASLPCGVPQSVSSWRFVGVIFATSSSREYLRCLDRSTILPSPARSSDNLSPSARHASLTIDWGILTAKLFPHFDTCVSFGIWIYIEYTPQPVSSAISAHPFAADPPTAQVS